MNSLQRVARWAAVLSFAALQAVAVAAPASRPPAARAATPPKATSRASTLSDAQLEKAIRARFARSKIAANKFEVRVQGGVATLEGSTGVVQHKGTATRLAKSAGATAVVNRIQVSEAAREKAAANLAKGRRRAQLKRGEERSVPRAQVRSN